MGKVVFLDIDGTLIDFHQHMPEGTLPALQKARDNGHKKVLCTDRTYTGIYPWLIRIPPDGIIASAGAYIRCGDEIISHHMLDHEKVRELLLLLKQSDITALVQGVHGRYAVSDSRKKILDFFRQRGLDGDRFLNGITIVEDPASKAALEGILYFDETGSVDEKLRELCGKLEGYFQILGSSLGCGLNYSGMFAQKGVSKASGMDELLAYWHIPSENSIAIGDGPDDMDMFRYAAFCTAMENGIPELKDMADYMTTNVENNGIAKAFRDLGLI